ncbi:MAG: hypothetical protein U0792_08795 [Gemmataceae bacterium]
MSQHVALFSLGFLLLAVGAMLLGFGLGHIARRLGAGPWAVGLGVVPLAAAAPVFAVTLTTAIQKNSDSFTVGMILGSDVVNIAFVLGVAALCRPLAGSSRLVNGSICTLFASVLFLWFVCRYEEVGRVEGGFLLAVFAVAVAYLVWSARNEPQEAKAAFEQWNFRRWPVWAAVPVAAVGIAALVYGASLVVPEAIAITRLQSKTPPRLFGTVAVALSSSLAVLVVAVVAARKNHGDLAMGTVAIANVCILLLLPAITALIVPFKIPSSMLMNDFPATALVTFLLLSPLLNGLRISRWDGLILLAAFAGYFVWQVRR